MRTFNYTITDPDGIQAAAAGAIVKEARRYASTISVSHGGKTVNALKMLALVNLGVREGDTIGVSIEGKDEEIAAPAIEAFFEDNF